MQMSGEYMISQKKKFNIEKGRFDKVRLAKNLNVLMYLMDTNGYKCVYIIM